MMGQHSRSESLFYCLRIEDQVPENHLLRLTPHVDHFVWDGPELKGRTQIGRVTILVLFINDPELIALRRALREGGVFGIDQQVRPELHVPFLVRGCGCAEVGVFTPTLLRVFPFLRSHDVDGNGVERGLDVCRVVFLDHFDTGAAVHNAGRYL